MTKKILTLALVGAMLATAFPSPAAAAAEDTAVTFTVAGGAGLTISVPAAANLGTTGPHTTLSAALGPVTVNDQRASLVSAWTATVVATPFKTGGGTPAETISNAQVGYWSGPATSVAGLGVFLPGQLLAIAAQSLDAPRTAYSLTAGVGSNSATWNPTLVVAVPPSAVQGTYTGTVTHSVV